jgi:hypothetical protein
MYKESFVPSAVLIFTVSTAGVSAGAAASSFFAVSFSGVESEDPPQDARATIARIAKNFFILLGF